MDNVTEWQHPFVDIFKRYNTFDAPKSFKGSVTVIHVHISSSRIPASPGNASKYRAPYSPITQSPSQIPMENTNSPIS
jgi:hypothetical protein